MLFAMYVKHTQEEVASVTTSSDGSMKRVSLTVKKAHENVNERTTKQIAKTLGWKLIGNQTLTWAACEKSQKESLTEKSCKSVLIWFVL